MVRHVETALCNPLQPCGVHALHCKLLRVLKGRRRDGMADLAEPADQPLAALASEAIMHRTLNVAQS